MQVLNPTDTARWDAIVIEPEMTVARLIFLLSKSLEASGGSAKIAIVDAETPKRVRLGILIKDSLHA